MQTTNQASDARPARERGMALVFTLLGLTLLSLLAASLMMVSSAGSFATLSFKNQMQAAYAAASGEQVALNWFRTSYTTWLDAHANPTGVYNVSGSQPTYTGSGGAVTLGFSSSSNFPDNTMISSFGGVATGTVTMGNASTDYGMDATLMTHEIQTNMTGELVAIERWALNVRGNVTLALGNASVQEQVVIERFFAPTFKDAIRAQCEVNLGGNILTDSFYSSNGGYGGSNMYTGASAQASVGSNTFIQATGNTGTINGNAYYGIAVGACSCPATPCEDFNHPSIVQGQILQSPGVPFPPIDSWDTTNASVNDCTGNNDRYLNPNNTGTPVTFPQTSAGHYHTCNPGGSAIVTLCVDNTTTTANFFFNNLTISGSQLMRIGHCGTDPLTGLPTFTACAAGGVNACAPIRLYVNQGLNLGGNGVVGVDPPQNGDPTKFSVIYSGTNAASYTGTSAFVGTVYAPNAQLTLRGGTEIYGAVSAQNVVDTGNVTVHYDLSLQNKSGWATTFRLVNQTRRVF